MKPPERRFDGLLLSLFEVAEHADEQKRQPEADENCEREVGAEDVLGAFACGGGGVELVAESFLCSSEEGHEHDADDREPDPDPACLRVLAADEAVQCFDDDVGGEQEEAFLSVLKTTRTRSRLRQRIASRRLLPSARLRSRYPRACGW